MVSVSPLTLSRCSYTSCLGAPLPILATNGIRGACATTGDVLGAMAGGLVVDSVSVVFISYVVDSMASC